jgi:threonine dehydratase
MKREPIPIEDIRAARERIKDHALITPLRRLIVDNAPTDIFLKLENMQDIKSFKIRGATNAMALADPAQLQQGVFTASAGNMAQGVAFQARRLGIPCTVIAPDHAPLTKISAIERLGGKVIKVPFAAWWQVLESRQYPGIEGVFIHPVSDPAVMAGNGTIGLEILEQCPDVDAVVIPYGGGGLSSGIASAIRAQKPDTKLYAVEVETAAPLSASLAAGRPVKIDYIPSFVDGIGSGALLPEMWPLVRQLLDGALVSSLREIADAIRLLADLNQVIAEGAGAASVAAALAGKAGPGKIVCVVSGGNIDADKLTTILRGVIP